MTRFLCRAVLLLTLAATDTRSQTFPSPGTGSVNWQAIGGRGLLFRSIQFGQDGTLYASASDSLYVLAPNPAGPLPGRWRSIGYARLRISAILPLDSAGDTLLAGVNSGGQLDRSIDHGASWTVVEGPSYLEGRSGGPRRPGGFFVIPAGQPHAGRLLAGGRFQFSDDRGATWDDAAISDPPLYAEAGAFALLPSGRILAAGQAGVAASDDSGETYIRTPIFGSFQFEGDGLAALATPGSTQSGTPACGQADASRCDGAVALTIEVPFEGLFAYRTNDGGRTWAPRIPLPQPDDGIGYTYTAGVVALPPGPDGLGRAVAVLGRGMVYRTMDGGQSWQAIGRSPLELDGTDWAGYLVMGPDRHLWLMNLRAGTQPQRVYRSAERVDDVLAVAGDAGPETETGTRLDVRPNPASGRVSVRLVTGAPSASSTVAVFDALGRRVRVLHDGPLAAGEHTFTADTATLPAGVYVVRVEGAGPSATARFTVAR